MKIYAQNAATMSVALNAVSVVGDAFDLQSTYSKAFKNTLSKYLV